MCTDEIGACRTCVAVGHEMVPSGLDRRARLRIASAAFRLSAAQALAHQGYRNG